MKRTDEFDFEVDFESHMEEASEAVNETLKKKRLVSRDPRKMRNLKQYRSLTDDEFEERMIQKAQDVEPSIDFERRIQMKLEKFKEDYDIDDLKFNDRETLRALIQAIISLEDYEQIMFKMKMNQGVTVDSLVLFDKINKIMSDLRTDISKLQADLKISRRERKSDQETSVIAYLDSLKDKAKRFYEQKHQYIICPNCNTLLGTVWTLYPNSDNRISLVCKKELDTGKLCNTKVVVTTKDLLAARGTNNKEVLPETLLN